MSETHVWHKLDWMDAAERVRHSKHVVEQARRVYPAYRLMHGDLNAMSEDEFIREVSRLVAIFFTYSADGILDGKDRTANVGGIQIIREDVGLGGPNYRIVLHGPFINDMRMVAESERQER